MATWQTTRVFMSTTFRDMHTERDYLVTITGTDIWNSVN
jgi:hypothetical protein